MTRDPMLDCITRYSVCNDYLTSRAAVGDEPFKGSTDVVLFSDLPALLAAAREDERKHHLRDAEQYGYEQGQRDERERIDSAVMPILATLARHACTAENWEQTDALTRRSVTDVKAAIRAREEKP